MVGSRGAWPRPNGSHRSRGRRRPRRSGATRASIELDLDRYRPFAAEELGAPGDERAPGGGPWAAEAGKHAGMIVVRDGRVVHHELDPALEAKGVRACGIATCDDDLVASCSAARRARPRTRSRCCTTRSSPAARSCTCPRASWSRIRSSSCTGARATAGRRSRTRSCRSARARRRRCSTASVHRRPIISSTRSPSCSSTTTRTCGTSRCRSTARAPGISASSARTSAATRRCARRRSRSAATTPACAARRCSTGQGAESDQLAVYFGDGEQMLDFRTLQDHDAPNTRSDLLVQGRGRGHRPFGVLGPRAPAADREEGERVADEPQPRAHRRRERGVDPEPRDRGERRALLARVDGRPDRRRAALLPRVARHPARGGRAPDRARILRRRVRAAARSAR